MLVTVLSLVALVAGAFALGRALFGTAAAYLGAVFVGSSFAFLLYAVRAFVDVPFLALVVWAAALEVRGAPRRGLVPMALLAAAGLLRPEAWVLAGLYWLWCLPGSTTRARAGLLALAAAGPLLWCLVDLAVTGDPLFSLTNTQALSDSLDRERGLGAVPSTFVTFLADLARPPVALAGVIGLGLALRRFGARRMAIPLALLGAGVLTFVAIGVAGLSLIPRYLTVPAVALCVLAGYAVMGFATLEPGPQRTRWRRAAVGALAVGVVFLLVKAGSFGALRSELRFIERTHDELSGAARRAARARGPALRRADVPDVPARARRALAAARRRRGGAHPRRPRRVGPLAGRRGGLHRRRREVRAALRARRRRLARDEPSAGRGAGQQARPVCGL